MDEMKPPTVTVCPTISSLNAESGQLTRAASERAIEPLGTVRAPMGGRVVSVAVAVGDHVARGQTLAIIEAMKIEHRVTATCDGTIERVAITAGGQVAARDVVVAITPDPS